MLSDEEKARIRAEEEARAKQKLEAQEERQKVRAALEFRESVKVELNPKKAGVCAGNGGGRRLVAHAPQNTRNLERTDSGRYRGRRIGQQMPGRSANAIGLDRTTRVWVGWRCDIAVFCQY
jgi:hypothetical protein